MMKFFNPKVYCVVLIMFLLSNALNAQKIKDNDGIITIDGKPYVKLTKKVKYILIYNDFWIHSLDGKELMFAQVKEKISRQYNSEKGKYEDYTSYYYEIHFSESEARVVINEQLGKKGLIKIVYKNKLIKDNQIDPIAERTFITKYGGSIHGIKSTALTTIKGDQIFHYNNLIGNFITQSTTSENGVDETILLVYNNSGEKVAEAIAQVENPIEWSVYTYRDEKMTFIKYEAFETKEKLFKWISDKKYL